MGLGHTPTQQALLASTVRFCEKRLAPNSIYRYLYQHAPDLFPDEAFADLFKPLGRDSTPPQIVAVVMVLQRLEGLSDRAAVERFSYDSRWKYAAGGLGFDYPGFVHTVLVRMRARLRKSDNPDRIFDVTLDVAKTCGLVGRKRVLDSTPIYDAVATQDTVTLIRSAVRGLLKAADAELEEKLRRVLKRDDDYTTPGKPECDWSDPQAREALIDALCNDVHALLEQLDGCQLDAAVERSLELLAAVVDQDTETTDDGRFRIARRVAKDRIISTVDPEARHGHKSTSRKFDGYKGHISLEPDSEIITATAVTPANVSDASVAVPLVRDVLESEAGATNGDDEGNDEPAHGAYDEGNNERDDDVQSCDMEQPSGKQTTSSAAEEQSSSSAKLSTDFPDEVPLDTSDDKSEEQTRPEIYGDASYGEVNFLEHCKLAGADTYLKVQPPSGRAGMFSKDAFCVDLERNTVTCPNQQIAVIRRHTNGSGQARFGRACSQCPMRTACTSAKNGRVVQIHAKERLLQEERRRQREDSGWRSKYKATRPKVERKFGHMSLRPHGGRRARVRGCERVAQDFAMLAAALNLQRLANLGAHPGTGPRLLIPAKAIQGRLTGM